MIYHGGKSVGGIWHRGKVVGTIYHTAKVVWQAIRSMFFTKDGAYVETRDGKIFDTKQ